MGEEEQHLPLTSTISTEQWSGSKEHEDRQENLEGDVSVQEIVPKPATSVKRKPVMSISIDAPPHDQPQPPLRSLPELDVQAATLPAPRAASRPQYYAESPQIITPDVEHQATEPLAYRPRINGDDGTHSRASSGSYPTIEEENGEMDNEPVEELESLQYHAFDDVPKKQKVPNRLSHGATQSVGSSSSGGDQRGSQLLVPKGSQRPTSMHSLGNEVRGRSLSPFTAQGSDPGSPSGYPRDLSSSRKSPRPTSYVNLLNDVPYHQQIPPNGLMSHRSLQSAVGNAASLLDPKKTLDMYRANIKKTTDMPAQYEFAIYMINCSQDPNLTADINRIELLNEAKKILERLADRTYPFAQYYLGDGYFSGLFNKSKPDHDKAFQLFVAASKHGHAEAGFRAALCYEFGWGCTKSYPKAVQFYRTSASKNHPGAATRLGLACLRNDMGLLGRDKYREGLKWLKRAQEGADYQYNAAPFELGLLHLSGFADVVFKDEAYAAQLFTQSAEFGHMEANFLMGSAYENGLYGCPRDAALSVHFYNGAATRGHAEAMMALTAWYMVGAEPVLEKDEREAYAWALKAAETGEYCPVGKWNQDAHFFRLNRLRKSRIRRWLLHRNGHRMSTRSPRRKFLVRPGRREGQRERKAAAQDHPRSSIWGCNTTGGKGREEEEVHGHEILAAHTSSSGCICVASSVGVLWDESFDIFAYGRLLLESGSETANCGTAILAYKRLLYSVTLRTMLMLMMRARLNHGARRRTMSGQKTRSITLNSTIYFSTLERLCQQSILHKHSVTLLRSL